MSEQLICLAEIVGVHGVKGLVKLKSFAENLDHLTRHGALLDAQGAPCLKFRSIQRHGMTLLAAIDGIDDRTKAEKLKGTKLYISRQTLPDTPEDNEYYHVDLIGLEARHVKGDILGKVCAVANFGAGDLLEIKPAKGNSFYVPFTDAIVPMVDLTAGYLSIDPPPGLID